MAFCVIGIGLKPGIFNRFDLRMRGKIFRHFKRVFAVTLHSQRKGFQSHVSEESVHRADCGAEVAHKLNARFSDVCGFSESLGVA